MSALGTAHSRQRHPNARLCACSSSNTTGARMSSFHRTLSPQLVSEKEQILIKTSSFSSELNLNNPDFSLPSLSPEPPQPGTRREHSGTPNLGLALDTQCGLEVLVVSDYPLL